MDQSQRIVAVVDLGAFDAHGSWPHQARFACRQLGRQTLLQRVVGRLSESQELSRIIVAGAGLPTRILTAGTSGAEMLDLVDHHPCERLATAADRSGAEWVMYVAANRPFVDPVLIDRLACQTRKAPESDYIGYCSATGGWARMAQLGVAGELAHADSLRRLRRHCRRLPDAGSPPTMADWFLAVPGKFHMHGIPVPPGLDHPDLRFTLENEDDWESAEILCEATDRDATEWQLLTDLLHDNDGLRSEMQDRNRSDQDALAAKFA